MHGLSYSCSIVNKIESFPSPLVIVSSSIKLDVVVNRNSNTLHLMNYFWESIKKVLENLVQVVVCNIHVTYNMRSNLLKQASGIV